MLEVNNLGFYKNGASILDGINFALKPGQILGLIGANGAGKSSVVNAILGDIEVTSGTVTLAGAPLKNMAPRQRAKHIAVLPQFSVLNFPFTVEEVVLLGRTPHDSGIKIDYQIAKAAMSQMDVAYLADRRYTQLSGGEKQRVQLARVLAQIWRAEDATPRLLILDEPTSSLDLGHKQQLMSAVKNFAQQNVAVLLVEHDLNNIAQNADEILALQCGRVKAYGKTNAVLTESLVLDLFGARVKIANDEEKLSVISCY